MPRPSGLDHPDAERAVLGSVLLDNAAWPAAAEVLAAEDFSLDAHRRIWRGMEALAAEGKPVDPVTLTEQLLRSEDLAAVGGVAALAKLTEGLPRSVNAAHYAQIVRDSGVRRRLHATLHHLEARAQDPAEELGALLDAAESQVLAAGSERREAGLLTPQQVLERSYGSLDALVDAGARQRGLASGYRALDALTCGFQPGEVALLAARPSMGKTALALAIAANVAIRGAGPVAFFSLEMSREALLERLLCAEARVDAHRFRAGGLSREERTKIALAAGALFASPLLMDDSCNLRLQELHARARRLRQERGALALVVVDYLQLMQSPRAENRTQEVAALSRGLKGIAKNLGVPLLGLSQLSRAPEIRGGERRPQLADLRDSGALEQDADLVLFLYRAEYYARLLGREPEESERGLAELTIAKQRNGPTGKLTLVFLERFGRFENIAEDTYE